MLQKWARWASPRSRSAEVERARPASGILRVLASQDLDEALALLDRDPVANVFVRSRIVRSGLDPWLLGCQVVGWERDGELVSLAHLGSNLVAVDADEEALDACVRYLGPHRRAASIMGVAETTMALWEGLSQRWGGQWSSVRDLRPVQPLMAIREAPQVGLDERVRPITMAHFDAYFEAAVAMYTEEVGVSPIKGNPASYKFYVRQLIEAGRAFGIVENGRVLYKSDLGSVTPEVGQIQGVWLEPSLRGRGFAPACMAGVVALAREQVPVLSLYVNDFNHAARRTYARAGFREQGEFATILY